jgi:hypothetical protein
MGLLNDIKQRRAALAAGAVPTTLTEQQVMCRMLLQLLLCVLILVSL